jgi:hypothetical protein
LEEDLFPPVAGQEYSRSKNCSAPSRDIYESAETLDAAIGNQICPTTKSITSVWSSHLGRPEFCSVITSSFLFSLSNYTYTAHIFSSFSHHQHASSRNRPGW